MPWKLTPPMRGMCPECATAHKADEPHNRDSLYYQTRFYHAHGRFPTWGDAMAHCNENAKQKCRAALLARGVRPDELEPGE